METRTIGCAVLAVLAMAIATAFLWGSSLLGGGLPDYRYRLTVEVETPEGLKTGSSVIEVKTAVAGRNSISVPGAVSHRVRGEAVTVDLGARGVLIALLHAEDNSDWASNVVYRLVPEAPRVLDVEGHRDFEAQFAAMLEHLEPIELPRTFPEQGHLKDQPARPMLVRLADIADPRTLERVDPDDLAADFGPGVRLRRITMQLTDDPVTTGIEERLTWLPMVYQILDKSFHPEGIPVGDFKGLFLRRF
ncbi:MAG: hypothetical protein B7Y88_12505 [Sphingomonadales bacterium 32-64-17]|nr:MAG: hypothetical protein B7Y88_12505 [Sphingomonadales bacterium 32-64-17]